MSSETFSYKGISAGKYIEGEIEALNQEEASFKLKEQKVIITNLTKIKKKKAEKEKKKGGGFSFGKKAVKPEDVMIFSKQFATMVKAGLPILNVLKMLRDQIEHPTMKEIIEERDELMTDAYVPTEPQVNKKTKSKFTITITTLTVEPTKSYTSHGLL